MGEVLVVGSLNLDHVVTVEHLPLPGETVLGRDYLAVPGGKGLNQVVTDARMGARARMAGCVGDDEAGHRLRQVLAGEGVDVTALRTVVGAPSGVALITVARGGPNTVVVAPGANSHLSGRDVEVASSSLGPAYVLLAQMEVPFSAVEASLVSARARRATTVLNPAPATGPLPTQLLELVDVLVPNQTEAAALSGCAGPEEAASRLLAQGCGSVLVTLGGEGVLLARPGQAPLRLAAYKVDAVDTTAAGDAFCGALAAWLCSGGDLVSAGQRANAAGALATTVVGALPSLPGAAAVDRLLATT